MGGAGGSFASGLNPSRMRNFSMAVSKSTHQSLLIVSVVSRSRSSCTDCATLRWTSRGKPCKTLAKLKMNPKGGLLVFSAISDGTQS